MTYNSYFYSLEQLFIFIYTQITYHFAQLGVPIPDARHGDSNIMHGLTAALEALTECTDAQLEKLKSPVNNSKVSF